jgi:hypothetical protein
MNKQKEKGSAMDGASRQIKSPVVVAQKGAVAVTGVQAF